jgi:hypothetical protein
MCPEKLQRPQTLKLTLIPGQVVQQSYFEKEAKDMENVNGFLNVKNL